MDGAPIDVDKTLGEVNLAEINFLDFKSAEKVLSPKQRELPNMDRI